MSQSGISGWRQIDFIDPEATATVLSATKTILNGTSNYTNTSSSCVYESQPVVLKPEQQEYDQLQVNFLIASSLISVIIIHGIFSQSRKAGVSGIFALACLAMTAILGPIVGSILLVLACYRQCVLAILKVTCKPGSFAGLMKGNDAFWALEEDTSRSVINILALADFSFIVEASKNNEEPLATVQELIEDRLLSHPHPFPKLLCYRKHYLGYFYWERQPYVSVAAHVRWMDIDEQSSFMIDNKKFVPETILKNYVSLLSNSPLPADHLSGWEILIGRYPVVSDCDNINNSGSIDPLDMIENGGNCDATIKYPVLFRVHHSLGDGVALVRLLLDALADPCTRTPSRSPTPSCEYKIPSVLINDKHDINGKTCEKFCKSTYLDIPLPADKQSNSIYLDDHERIMTMKKSASYNFGDWNSNSSNNFISSYNKSLTPSSSFKDCVRAACRRFINLIEETNRLNNLQYQTQSLQNIHILINDTPTLNGDIYNRIVNSKSTMNVTVTAANTTNLSSINRLCDNSDLHQRRNIVTREDRKRFDKLFIEHFDDSILDYDENNSKSVINFIREKIKSVKNILYHLTILSLLPITVMNQAITRTFDVNALHGPKLSGHKVVGWYLENTNDENKSLMSMIKRIRLCTGAHFSDVVLTGISNSFEEFFKRFNEVPNVITAVIPARIGRPNRDEEYNAKVSTATIKSNELSAKITKLYLDRNARRNHSVLYETSETSLDNKFSVALLTIPIASKSSECEAGLFTKLKRVQEYTDVLRKSADYIVNYWILNVVATLFPIPCLRNMVKSTQSSLVVSNMPGPQTLAKLAGHLLHNIVFWVPNRETTGVGVTILSYNDRLQLGIIADRALIPCSEDAQLIINGIVETIKRMDDTCSRSFIGEPSGVSTPTC